MLAQMTSARSSVQSVSRGRASWPWSTRPAGKPRRRSPVSSMRCPPIRFRRPGSGCSAVRCPVTWGRCPESGARPSAVHPSSVQPSAVQPSGVCPVRPDASVSSHSGAGVGTRSSWPGDRDHRNRWRPCGCRAVNGSIDGREAGTRATLPTSRWSLGGGWRTRAAGVGAGRGGRACPLERPGRPGRGSARRGRLRGGHGSRLQREVAAPPRGWRPRLGGRPRWVVVAEPAARVGGPGGATGGAGGDGRAAPARPKPAASAPGSLPAAL